MNLKRTINVFGRAVPVSVLAVLAMAGLGSAALVGYLSNSVSSSVSVNSPMAEYVSTDGAAWTQDALSFAILGGESKTFYVKTQNNANVPITGYGENIVTNPSGVTCADFVSVNARTSSDGGLNWSPTYDLIALGACHVVDDYAVEFIYGPQPNTWPASPYADVSEITATFKANALGTYTFTSQIIV